MTEKPYGQHSGDKLILRDYLAIDRTILANERTLLAYIRTALTFLVVGGTLLQLFDTTAFRLLAVVLIAIGTAFFIVGGLRFRTMHNRLRRGEETGAPPPAGR